MSERFSGSALIIPPHAENGTWAGYVTLDPPLPRHPATPFPESAPSADALKILPSPKRWHNAMMAGAALLSLSSGTHSPEKPAETTSVVVDYGPPMPLPSYEKTRECPPVEQRALAATEAMLAQPEAPFIKAERTRWSNDTGKAYSDFIGPTKNQRHALPGTLEISEIHSSYLTAQFAAAETGEQVHDPLPYLMQIGAQNIANADTPNAAQFNQYYLPAKAYLAEFGVSVQLDNDGKPYSFNGKAPTPEQLETPQAKQHMIELIAAYANQPQGFVDLAGLKYIRYMINSRTGGYAPLTKASDTYYIEIKNGPKMTTHHHEGSHLADRKMCGQGAGNDPHFRSMAETTTDKNVVALTPYSEDDFDRGRTVINEKLELALNRNDLEEAKRLYDRITTQQAKINLASDGYGGTSVGDEVEAKARLNEELWDGARYKELLHPNKPILKKRFTTVLARIGQHSAKLAKFFGRLGQRVDNRFPEPTFDDTLADFAFRRQDAADGSQDGFIGKPDESPETVYTQCLDMPQTAVRAANSK